jgi:4-amino-4-deoxy-L-arabinose transferase-like glycosyltransferase
MPPRFGNHKQERANVTNNGLFQWCNRRWQGRNGHYALLAAASWLLFFLNLGGASLWDVDEGRNSTAAEEMLYSNNWIKPTFNNRDRFDKPALLYWLQATGYQLFGINEFAARLPSALAALTAVLLCYELGRRLFSAQTALCGGLMVASTPMFCAAARFANPDALLNCFTVLTFLLFWRGYPSGGWFWFASMGAAMGLAVLAKGPVGLVMPLTVMGLFLLWNRRLRLFWNRRFLLGAATFCAVALPWYILVAIETKAEFLRVFILNHNVNRALSPMENHCGSLFYYPLIMILGFAPWSLFFGPAAWYSVWSVIRQPRARFQKCWERAADREAGNMSAASAEGPLHAYRFLLCWIVVYLGFFTLAATKLPNYILPIYVPTALLCGRFFERWRRGAIAPPAWTMQLALGGLVFVGVAVAFGLMLAGGLVRLSFMNDHYVEGMEIWAPIGLLLVAGGIIGLRYMRRDNRSGVLVSVMTATVLFIAPMAGWAALSMNRHKAPQPLVAVAGARQRDREIRIGCWQLEHLPSLNFYCQRDVIHHSDEEKAIAFLRYPLIQVFLFVPEPLWRDLEKKVHSPYRVAGRRHDMYQGCDVVVVTNR